MSKGKHLTESEKEYVLANHKEMTIVEMSAVIKRARQTIYWFCWSNNLDWKLGKRGKPKKAPREEKVIVQYSKQPGPRPAAIYTNSPTPFGIADELHRNPMSFCSF